MNKTSDASASAAEFLKRWQDEMTRQLHDPDMIRAMLAAMQPFGATRHDENARQPAHAPDADHDAITRLARRVDALERAVAKLSKHPVPVAPKAKNTAGAAKRRRAKPVAATKRPVAKKSKPATKPTRKNRQPT